ncbi:MAG: S24/S26 family peptidase [Bacteriovoracales bacterium]|nr:S24/S26 family peptidase [Bacteriovoracales bacterium]
MKLSDDEFWLHQKRIKRGDHINIEIVSESMSPLINKGDILRVRHKKLFSPFDIVVYRHIDGTLICHYIWERSRLDQKTWLLRSIKGTAFDLPVRENQILGHITHKKIGLKMKIAIFLKLFALKVKRGLL